MEAAVTTNDSLWDEPSNEPVAAIINPAAIQFLNGSLRIGQLRGCLKSRLDSKKADSV